MNRLHIQFKLVFFFCILILTSYVGDYFHTFLGNWHCNGGTTEYYDNYYHYKGCLYLPNNSHESTWHYGFRHWVLIAMGFTIFIWNIIVIFKKYADK